MDGNHVVHHVRDPAIDWSRAVPLAGRVLGGAVSILCLATTVEPALALAGAPGPRIGAAILLATQVTAAVALVANIRVRPTAALLTLTYWVGATLMTTAGRPGMGPVDWSPGWWATPVILLGLASITAKRAWQPLAVLVVGVCALDTVGAVWRIQSWQMAFLGIVSTLAAIITVALFLDAIGLQSRRQRLRAEQADRAREAAEATEHETHARQAAARIVHDHVLHALHALATPLGGLDADDVIRCCRDALMACAAPHETAPTPLADALAADPVTARVGAVVSGRVTGLPLGVQAAFLGATREAMTNVERHADATTCRLTCWQTGTHATVRITDDGRGFDPLLPRPGHFGISQSVQRRMAEVGGLAQVESAPGHGTRVTLEWPASTSPGTRLVTTDDHEEVRRRLARTAVPGIVQAVIIAAVMLPGSASPVLSGTTTIASLAIGLWIARKALRSSLGRADSVLLVAAALVGWLANLRTTPHTATNGYLLWMSGGATAMVQILLVTLPLTRAALLAVALIATIVTTMVIHFGASATFGSLYGSITAALDVAVCGMAALGVATVFLRQTNLAWARGQHWLAASQDLRTGTLLDAWWSRRALEPSLDLLESIVDGHHSPCEEEVQRDADRLSADLRDEMRLGPAAADLCSATGHLRRLGWAVTMGLDERTPQALLDAARNLVERIGPPNAPSQRLTVGGDLDTLRASAVIIDATPEQVSAWHQDGRLTLIEDPDFVAVCTSTDAREATR